MNWAELSRFMSRFEQRTKTKLRRLSGDSEADRKQTIDTDGQRCPSDISFEILISNYSKLIKILFPYFDIHLCVGHIPDLFEISTAAYHYDKFYSRFIPDFIFGGSGRMRF